MRLKFDGTEEFFQGHFPGYPILPGVVQLDLAVKHSPIQGRALKAVKKMKFMQIIAPGMEVELELKALSDSEVEYRFVKEGEICSSGVLVY